MKTSELKPLSTAVLFLVYNRLSTTKKVFKQIKKAKPPKLYISGDGAKNNIDDCKKVNQVRKFLKKNIDWRCQVKLLFNKKNLGCKLAVTQGITWFFKHEEYGIILEDDCLPSQSFFWFTENLLQRYKNNKKIFIISGYNANNIYLKKESDYFFHT